MRSTLKWVAIIGLGVFFLLTGISKLVDPAAFSLAIEQYRLFGGLTSWILALWIPWIESLAALMLFVPRFRLASALTLGGMLVVFEIALASAAFRGLDISCGCLGGEQDSSISLAIVRNLILIGMVVILLWTHKRRPA